MVLQQPSPVALVDLQEALLSSHAVSPAQRQQALDLAEQFYVYLAELQAKLTASQYSEFASWLDMAAVGLIGFEELLHGSAKGWGDVLVGIASESTMILGSRQYVKSWRVELQPIHQQAAWRVRQALWQISEEMQPELPTQQRLDALRRLLPLALSHAASSAQAAVLGRLFQVLLLLHIVRGFEFSSE